MSAKRPRNTLRGEACYSADELVEYVQSDARRAEIDEHLQNCKRCRLELARVKQALTATFEAESGTDVPEHIRAHLWARIEGSIDELENAPPRKVAQRRGFRASVESFVRKYLPATKEEFDIVWHLFETEGLLGRFHPEGGLAAQVEVGFVPLTKAGMTLPIIIGVCSNLIAAVAEGEGTIDERLQRQEPETVRILREYANMGDDDIAELLRKLRAFANSDLAAS